MSNFGQILNDCDYFLCADDSSIDTSVTVREKFDKLLRLSGENNPELLCYSFRLSGSAFFSGLNIRRIGSPVQVSTIAHPELPTNIFF